MRLIIEAHLVDDEGSTERIQLATINRSSTTAPLGMSLAEGKALLAAAQQHLVSSQCQGISSAHAHCDHCDARLGLKGWHQRQIKTVFSWSMCKVPGFATVAARTNPLALPSALSHCWYPPAWHQSLNTFR